MRATDVRFSITSPSGQQLISGTTNAHSTVTESGWNAVRIEADKQAAGSAAYELTVTYCGTGSL
jgi:hypothetical protein